MIAEYRAKAEAFAANKLNGKLKDQKLTLKDGHQVELAANIGTPKDLEGVCKQWCRRCWLSPYRIPYGFLYEMPTEEDQSEATKLLRRHEWKPVKVVRTMDIGGDKELPHYQITTRNELHSLWDIVLFVFH